MKLAMSAMWFALIAPMTSALTLSGAPAAHILDVQRRGNISFWTSKAAKFEPYTGNGCEDWCAEGAPCDIPPCSKCEICPKTDVAFLEVGSIDIGGFKKDGPQNFAFTTPFSEAPVVVTLPSTRGGHPASIRIFNVTPKGFKAVLVEPAGEDGPHVSMKVDFLAAATGVHRLPDGHIVQAWKINTKKSVMGWRCKPSGQLEAWEKVKFLEPLDKQPALLAAVQTMANEVNKVPKKVSEPFLAVAVKDLTFEDVRLSLERLETGKKGSVEKSETIGIVAIAAGSGKFMSPVGEIQYTASVSARLVRGWQNGKGQSVPLADVGSDKPLVIAGMCTRNGPDGGWLRIRKAEAKSVRVTVDEDRSCDKERRHTTEQVCVTAFSGPFVQLVEAPPLAPLSNITFD